MKYTAALLLTLLVPSLACSAAGDDPFEREREHGASRELPATEETPQTAAAVTAPQGSGLTMGVVSGRIYDDLASNPGARMSDLRRLGVKMLRLEIECGDAPCLARYKTIVDAAKRYGIETLALVSGAAVGDPRQGDIEAFAANYVAFVDNLLATIPGLTYIEVFNEPDVYDFAPLATHAHRYALLTTRVFEAYVVRNGPIGGRPQIVAFDFVRPDEPGYDLVYNDASITNHRKGFRPQRGMPDGLPAHIVSIHGYGTPDVAPWQSNYGWGAKTFAQSIDWFLNRGFAEPVQGNSNLVHQTPVWITEVGFQTDMPGGAQAQADSLSHVFDVLETRPQITAAFWYDYRDDEPGGTEQCGLRGNSTTGFEIHPSYWSYQAQAGGSQASTFVDVPRAPAYWAHDEIEALFARGITRGCGGTLGVDLSFCPESSVTRGEMAAFVARAQGDLDAQPGDTTYATRAEMAVALSQALGAWEPNPSGKFSDVPPGHWADNEIEGVAAKGWANGYGDGTFGPGDTLTRAQMAAFISRAWSLR